MADKFPVKQGAHCLSDIPVWSPLQITRDRLGDQAVTFPYAASQTLHYCGHFSTWQMPSRLSRAHPLPATVVPCLNLMRSYYFQTALKFLGSCDPLALVSQIAGIMGLFYQCTAGDHPDSDSRRQGQTISPPFLQSLWIWGHDGWNPGGFELLQG